MVGRSFRNDCVKTIRPEGGKTIVLVAITVLNIGLEIEAMASSTAVIIAMMEFTVASMSSCEMTVKSI